MRYTTAELLLQAQQAKKRLKARLTMPMHEYGVQVHRVERSALCHRSTLSRLKKDASGQACGVGVGGVWVGREAVGVGVVLCVFV
jgi:hypothetical protein